MRRNRYATRQSDTHQVEDNIENIILSIKPRLVLIDELTKGGLNTLDETSKRLVEAERKKILDQIDTLVKTYNVDIFHLYGQLGGELVRNQILTARDELKKKSDQGLETDITDQVDEDQIIKKDATLAGRVNKNIADRLKLQQYADYKSLFKQQPPEPKIWRPTRQEEHKLEQQAANPPKIYVSDEDKQIAANAIAQLLKYRSDTNKAQAFGKWEEMKQKEQDVLNLGPEAYIAQRGAKKALQERFEEKVQPQYDMAAKYANIIKQMRLAKAQKEADFYHKQQENIAKAYKPPEQIKEQIEQKQQAAKEAREKLLEERKQQAQKREEKLKHAKEQRKQIQAQKYQLYTPEELEIEPQVQNVLYNIRDPEGMKFHKLIEKHFSPYLGEETYDVILNGLTPDIRTLDYSGLKIMPANQLKKAMESIAKIGSQEGKKDTKYTPLRNQLFDVIRKNRLNMAPPQSGYYSNRVIQEMKAQL